MEVSDIREALKVRNLVISERNVVSVDRLEPDVKNGMETVENIDPNVLKNSQGRYYNQQRIGE